MTAWLAVVSAAHVRRAQRLGIVQTNHGKRAGIARMSPGDTIIFYSPTRNMGDKEKLQAFTALGTVDDDEIWQANEGTFKPFRRAVTYEDTRNVPLAELRDALDLTSQPNWGYQLRRGLLELAARDAELIASRMRA